MFTATWSGTALGAHKGVALLLHKRGMVYHRVWLMLVSQGYRKAGDVRTWRATMLTRQRATPREQLNANMHRLRDFHTFSDIAFAAPTPSGHASSNASC